MPAFPCSLATSATARLESIRQIQSQWQLQVGIGTSSVDGMEVRSCMLRDYRPLDNLKEAG
eukprot:373879-Amphidinium_carterae.1